MRIGGLAGELSVVSKRQMEANVTVFSHLLFLF
jgi:hypothetical protein